jgi:hypothetical protein
MLLLAEDIQRLPSLIASRGPERQLLYTFRGEDADADIPILKEAKAEYAKLQ